MTLQTQFFPVTRTGISTDMGRIRISGIAQDDMGAFLSTMTEMGLSFHLGPRDQLDIAPVEEGHAIWAITAQGDGVLAYLVDEEDRLEACDEALAALAARSLRVGSILRIDGFQEIDPGRYLRSRIDISVEDGDTYVARREDMLPVMAC